MHLFFQFTSLLDCLISGFSTSNGSYLRLLILLQKVFCFGTHQSFSSFETSHYQLLTYFTITQVYLPLFAVLQTRKSLSHQFLTLCENVQTESYQSSSYAQRISNYQLIIIFSSFACLLLVSIMFWQGFLVPKLLFASE